MVNSSTIKYQIIEKKKKIRTYADGPDFGQIQTCGSVKPVY